MTFEVIPGGLLFEDDISAPNKPIEEWTAEEKEEYDRCLWENAEKGTVEYTIKNLDISAERVNTLINTLETIKAATQEDAAAAGYVSDWKITTAEELLSWMLRKNNEQQLPPGRRICTQEDAAAAGDPQDPARAGSPQRPRTAARASGSAAR